MAAGLVNLTILDGNQVARTIQVWSSDGTTSGSLSFLQTIAGADKANPASSTNGLPVSLNAGNATIGVVSPLQVTPTAGTSSTITTGNASVTVVTGPCNGGYITNPPNLASQGIGAAENAYIDPVGTPGSTDALAHGTTTLLAPGQSYAVPALAAGSVIKANAATSGHRLTVAVW